MAEDAKFGLVGAGIMGKGLVRNLLAGGFEVAVVDHDAAALDRAREMGASPANGLAGLCAAADLLGTCLQSVEAVREVYLGAGGLIETAREGSVLIDFSTSDPILTLELAAAGEARGVQVIDAPMLRMEQHAWDGNLVLLVGGDDAVVARCAPAFEAVSERFVHCGPVGSGHTFKLLNNINGLCIHAAYAETFALAEKLGVDRARLLDVLTSGMSGSTILDAVSKRMITGADGPVFATDVAMKDISLFAKLAADTKSPSLMADAARELYRLTSLAGHGDADIVSVARPPNASILVGGGAGERAGPVLNEHDTL
jgi:3-hydroxyisobutyrate dehydrogenase-like beta-hydroxyacid dehydrogenase